MKKLFLVALAILVLAIASPALALEKSDLLTISVKSPQSGNTIASVKLDKGKGPSIEDALNGAAFDLFGNATLAEFTVEPFFDETQYPGAPPRIRLVYEPVVLRAGQPFFGFIGFFTDTAPGHSEEFLRKTLMYNYEIEVNGVMVQGDALDVVGPFPCFGTFYCTSYNVTQRITEAGTYQLVYRALQAEDDTFGQIPAEIAEIFFTVVIKE